MKSIIAELAPLTVHPALQDESSLLCAPPEHTAANTFSSLFICFPFLDCDRDPIQSPFIQQAPVYEAGRYDATYGNRDE